ncbi:MAG TPA: hypothetical protein PKL17_04900 [Pseudomonadota bacterium]|nr:hypothetical protein [Pseudomonadota bacterium]HNK44097.1 hypothetical protein [Pseudomonadota bacterium]
MSLSPPSGSGDAKSLYSDEYACVLLTNEARLIRLKRTAQAYPDLSALLGSYEKVIAAIDRTGRRGRALLVDTRAPSGRNDAWFEQGMASVRPRIDRGFARVGVLTQTRIGTLQIRRWVNEDGIERLAGCDEELLIAELLSGLLPRPRFG